MKLHLLVEGPSEKAFLDVWLKRLLPGLTFQVITHQGKGKLSGTLPGKPDPKRRGLLDQLPAKLRAYNKTLNSETDRIVVLVDLDDGNCVELLARLKNVAAKCSPNCVVLFRIAIEETEAYFLGDSAAIRKAFSKAKLAKLKNHEYDSICGTWEKLRDIIGEPATSDDKVGWAEAIAPHLGTKWKGGRGSNKSPSFCKLCEGLVALCGETAKSKLK
jgi:hypothetical protein